MRIARILFVGGLAFSIAAAGARGASAQSASAMPTSLHVVLLQATAAQEPVPTTLPPSLQLALRGAIGAKPFKSLRLLDQAVVPALGDGGTRLSGTIGVEYVLAVSGGAASGAAANELGIAVHLFATKNGALEPTAPEVLWGEFTAKSGESVFVWPYDEKKAGGEPLVLVVTPLSAPLASSYLQAPAKRAGEVLTSILSGECGLIVDASWASAPPQGAATAILPSDWKTTNARLESGSLLFERSRVAPAGAGASIEKPRVYSIKMRDLMAPEFRVSFAPRPEDPFVVFSFMCGTAGCVTVDAAPENVLRVRVCTDRASELMKALQVLIVQAGGSWQ
jgi:hypothetical protein